MNLKQRSNLGVGLVFPIKLTTPLDDKGNPETTIQMVNGVPQEVIKVGWYPETNMDLVKNNITSILTYNLGERFRQENFGSRLWECLEEPNISVLTHMATKFIKEAVVLWETRVTNLSVDTLREGSKLFIQARYSIGTEAKSESLIEYDHSTDTYYAY